MGTRSQTARNASKNCRLSCGDKWRFGEEAVAPQDVLIFQKITLEDIREDTEVGRARG
jgi:hypothetical protein